ncbi:MAG TPA: V-type ATP synthase subunit F [archaeon]|nr:V-type ATP synthase subunit F [archaeon]
MDGELKHSIAVVADGPTCTGFRLAGVQMVFPIEALEAQKDATQGKAAENKSAGGGQIAAEQKIEELLADEGIGIMIVSEKTMGAMDWRLKKKIERLAKPVVIAVPDKSGPVANETDSLRSMVKKALGFELMK